MQGRFQAQHALFKDDQFRCLRIEGRYVFVGGAQTQAVTRGRAAWHGWRSGGAWLGGLFACFRRCSHRGFRWLGRLDTRHFGNPDGRAFVERAVYVQLGIGALECGQAAGTALVRAFQLLGNTAQTFAGARQALFALGRLRWRLGLGDGILRAAGNGGFDAFFAAAIGGAFRRQNVFTLQVGAAACTQIEHDHRIAHGFVAEDVQAVFLVALNHAQFSLANGREIGGCRLTQRKAELRRGFVRAGEQADFGT